MNTKQLKLFLLISDIKSFSKAAELEALTQPAVTQQISRLEKELGSVLFRRRHKKVELTKKGKLFYKFAKNILYMMENLQKEMKSVETADEGIIRIGSSHIPTSQIIYDYIIEFKKMYPKAYFIYEINDTSTITNMVLNELVDIGFVGAIVDENLEYVSLKGDEIKLAAPASMEIPPKITLAQLKKLPLIINQKESGVRQFLENKLEEYRLKITDLNIIAEIGLPETIISFVKKGMGCAFLPSIILEREIQNGEMKIIDIRNFSARRNYYLVKKQDSTISDLTEKFIKGIIERFK